MNKLDFLTPTALEFQPNSIIFGDRFSKIYAITDYANELPPAFLSKVSNMTNVVCSIHIQPTNSSKLIKSIDKTFESSTSKLNSDTLSASEVSYLSQQIEDSGKLLEKMSNEQQLVFYVTVILQVLSPNEELLERACSKVEGVVASYHMRARVLTLLQEQGLTSIAPFVQLDKDVSELAKRNMPSESVAGLFPFTTSTINDGEGILIGTDHQKSICLIDIWKRGEDRTNSNIVVLGKMGMGKTTLMKKLLTYEYAMGTKIIILDPEGEYKDTCITLDGSWVDAGGGTNGIINFLQSFIVPETQDNQENKKVSHLSLQMQFLRTFYKLYFKTLNQNELEHLEICTEEVYQKFNINFETDLTNLKATDYPIPMDLFDYVYEKTKKEKEKYENIALALRKCSIGADKHIFNGHTTINTDKHFIVIDIKSLQSSDNSLKTAQYYNIFRYIWYKSTNRDEKTLINIDESHLLIDPDVPQALNELRNVAKRCRKYNTALVTGTQNISDYLAPEIVRTGSAVLNVPTYKFFLGAGEQELKQMIGIFDLTEGEIELIKKSYRGQALLIAGNKRANIKIEVMKEELELFGKGGGN